MIYPERAVEDFKRVLAALDTDCPISVTVDTMIIPVEDGAKEPFKTVLRIMLKEAIQVAEEERKNV